MVLVCDYCTGEKKWIYAEASDTILILKVKIENKWGVSRLIQRLISDGGEQLEEDHRTLSYYNIGKEDIVHLLLRIVGGAKPPKNWDPAHAVKGDGYKQTVGEGSSGLVYDGEKEAGILRQCMDTWQKSSRCCDSSCGDRCGLVIMNLKSSGHCRNVLFERCAKHGGDGHENLIREYNGDQPINCALIYGYSIQNEKIRLNSGTFNGTQMPDEMKRMLPEVFNATRAGDIVTIAIPPTLETCQLL